MDKTQSDMFLTRALRCHECDVKIQTHVHKRQHLWVCARAYSYSKNFTLQPPFSLSLLSAQARVINFPWALLLEGPKQSTVTLQYQSVPVSVYDCSLSTNNCMFVFLAVFSTIAQE